MTTIAYRDGVLAADTLTTRGATAIVGVTKVAKGGTRMGGACGGAGFCSEWLAWIREERPEPPEAKCVDDCNDVGMVVHADGRLEIYEPSGAYTIETPYYAFGSGRDQALGAMFAGADAETAVRAACEHDVYTGGPVTVLRREA